MLYELHVNFVIKNLSKHTWRCKSKITSITTVATESTNRPLTSNESLVTVNNNNNEITTWVNQDFDPHENKKPDHEFRCYCGRSFNSLRGFNIHRRTCFVAELIDTKELFKDAVEEIANDATHENEEIIVYKDLHKCWYREAWSWRIAHRGGSLQTSILDIIYITITKSKMSTKK